MWTMTTTGFYSVVAAEQPGLVMIRARSKSDLVALLKRFGTKKQQGGIRHTPDNDYLFRVIVRTETWSRWLGKMAMDAGTYPNFKDAVRKKSVVRSRTYHKVWDACLEIESEDSLMTDSHRTRFATNRSVKQFGPPLRILDGPQPQRARGRRTWSV